MIRVQTLTSPLGELTLAEEDGCIIGLWLEGQKHFPDLSNAVVEPSPVLLQAEQWLKRYFDGQQPSIQELPLSPRGSAFRQQVWQLLCRIPYGQTTSYAALAEEIARNRGIPKMSAQAVGNAVGHNPISILIPCHRVVGADGSLTGYAGGLELKRALLTLEGASPR